MPALLGDLPGNWEHISDFSINEPPVDETGGHRRSLMTWSVAIIEVGVMPGARWAATSWTLGGRSLDLPCYCWLLRDGPAAVLVDSGPDAASFCRGSGYEVAGTHGHRCCGASGGAASRLPRTSRPIVHTHLHQDHVQNDPLFPRAEMLVQRGELTAALDGEAACASLTPGARAELAGAPYAVSQEAGIWYIGTRELVAGWRGGLRQVDGDEEVAPGLRVIWSGAHTRGHQSVVVETCDGEVCITGDIVSLEENAASPGPMTPARVEAEAFLGRARAGKWELIPSHEPAVRRHRWYAGA